MKMPVIVYPPDPSGGRRVRAGKETLGVAHSQRDVVELLRGAGLAGVDEAEIPTTSLIQWHGGGPDVWPAPG
ncbi:hypothetical protein ACIPW9_12220 [Streptomyces sp. NPDC090052]|uniref:hypothetical protein n=1 Tax=unclassified Streptomyces TaxID=2593676 RepID=UPI002257C8D7|nr:MULTISPECIES: hypothetical protein [unclassified Streptomyces]MCX4725932.1 hypothetical protein [Streptomyces sp. NBC_01306]WSV04734.1 hypothetical protein OG372_14700 [Streptomyces sp. NBC_01020]WSX42797.1 hypothetical protein OG760_14385 [Streptomyces sp. NBC_00963]WSX69186.1 hypothetical protein OG221_22715 [Streptomyces sp. NBC_00932]